jgi:aromatic ring hydroxylase
MIQRRDFSKTRNIRRAQKTRRASKRSHRFFTRKQTRKQLKKQTRKQTRRCWQTGGGEGGLWAYRPPKNAVVSYISEEGVGELRTVNDRTS